MIYEVNLSVDREIAEAYASWLEPHMAQMLEFEGFESATWLAREPEMEGDHQRHVRRHGLGGGEHAHASGKVRPGGTRGDVAC